MTESSSHLNIKITLNRNTRGLFFLCYLGMYATAIIFNFYIYIINMKKKNINPLRHSYHRRESEETMKTMLENNIRSYVQNFYKEASIDELKAAVIYGFMYVQSLDTFGDYSDYDYTFVLNLFLTEEFDSLMDENEKLDSMMKKIDKISKDFDFENESFIYFANRVIDEGFDGSIII